MEGRTRPVWSHDGGVCTGESYKQVVKLTFFRGASLKDPKKLFNSSLEGNTRRAIDLREGEKINEAAFKQLIRAAVAANSAALRSTGSQEEVSPALRGMAYQPPFATDGELWSVGWNWRHPSCERHSTPRSPASPPRYAHASLENPLRCRIVGPFTRMCRTVAACPPSAEQRRGLDANARQQLRLQLAVPADTYRRRVAVGRGLPADLDVPGREIDDPEFRNGVTGVERALHGTVVVQAGVGHFDQQQDIGRPSVGVLVKVRPRLEQREVRLRLAEVVEPNRSLHRTTARPPTARTSAWLSLLTVPW